MDTKVILPTLMRRGYEYRGDDPSRRYEVQRYNKYEFTLKDALQFMIDTGREYMFEDMILHNVNMRNQLRKIGAKNLVEQLRSLVTPSDSLDRRMSSFVEKWDGKTLNDIDIQVVPISEPFVLDDMIFDGLNEIKASVDRSYKKSFILDDSPKDITPTIQPQCHVGEVWESYPKFDIYDSCDNRYYANYLIRKCPVQDQELKSVYDIARCNYCAVNENTPLSLLPIVYYVGDGGFMLVAERHQDTSLG